MLGLLIANGMVCALWMLFRPFYVKEIAGLSIIISWVLFYKISGSINLSLSGLQIIEEMDWIPSLHIQWFLAMDTLSYLMCALTLFIHTMVVLSVCYQHKDRLAGYISLFMVLQSMTLGVFMAFDAILFYIFWEAMLIPMYLCICGWGSKEGSFAAMKFFLFTFVGSLLMLIGFLYLGIKAESFSLVEWVSLPLNLNEQRYLFLCLLPGFAIKVPMFPLHTWLPSAHTEAPSEGSVVLAGLMLKVGVYGLIRILMPILPDACRYFSAYMLILSIISILYIGIVAFSQKDIKKLIAYSSVSHMGFVTLGLFLIYYTKLESLAILVFVGAVMQMITHAFGSGALFLSFGMLYTKVKKRDISVFQGLYTQVPWFSFFFMLFIFSTMAVPGTAGFVGEWIVITSAIMIHPLIGICAVLGIVISAAYLLNLVRQIFFHKPSLAVSTLIDSNYFECSLLGVFSLCIIIIGIYPMYLIKVLMPSAASLVKIALSSKVGGI